jgi:AraC-like DNA-binding protein
MWRAFPRELADVLCIECTAGLPMRMYDELAIVLPRAWARLTDPLGRSTLVGPGDVGLVHPGELCRIGPAEQGEEICVLLVARELLDRDARFACRVAHDPQLAAQLHAVWAELRRGLTALEVVARFREALSLLVRRHAAAAPDAWPISRSRAGAVRAHRYLLEHFTEAVSLEALAELSKLNRFHLLRVFRREFGVTPHEYQRHLRLARASRLLAGGSAPSRAAYQAGFCDQSHLTRQLKSLTGLTPAVFARQCGAPA